MLKIKNTDFVKLLDETLEGLYGIHARSLLYNYLKRKYSLKKSEILCNPDLFIEALLSLFGEYGTNLIERQILRAIENNLPLERAGNGLTHEQIVEYSNTLTECISYINKNEAKIYVALLSYGMMRVSKIVKLTEVPRQKIYQYAQNLIELGIIHKRTYNNVTYFIPKHPEYILKDHFGVMEGKLNIFKQLINELSNLCKNVAFHNELNGLEKLYQAKNS